MTALDTLAHVTGSTTRQRTETRGQGGVEIRVRRNGQPYLRKVLTEFPANIGRDRTNGVCLASSNVSRVHARLRFDGTTIRIEDAGSTNGFAVNGVRASNASLSPRDVVRITEFELRARPAPLAAGSAASPPAPMEQELSEGWLEIERGDDREITNVRPLTEAVGHGTIGPVTLGESARVGPRDNRALVQSLGGHVLAGTGEVDLPVRTDTAAHPRGEDDEDDDDEATGAPDLPPLLGLIEDESNALLYTAGGDDYAVEVVVSLGDRVHDMALLAPGQSYWWGGSPRGTERLWIAPTPQRFPLVEHVHRGRYEVRVPEDPHWRLSHRGAVAATSHRSGPLLSCEAEIGEQVHARYGPYAILVRGVLAPPQQAWRMPWTHLRPGRLLGAALFVSALTHAGVMALPADHVTRINGSPALARDHYADVTLAPTSPAQEDPPTPTRPNDAPRQVPTVAVEHNPPTRLRPGQALRTRRTPSAQRATAQAPAAVPTPRPAGVSVADFKVLGLMPHMPEVHLDEPTATSLGGGQAMLRDDSDSPGPLVQKDGRTMQVTPTGRISSTAVHRVVNREASSIGRCYNDALRGQPNLRGRIELEWLVDKRGVASGVRVLYDSTGSQELADCMRTVVMRWVFPKPAGGTARISFPFSFQKPRF